MDLPYPEDNPCPDIYTSTFDELRCWKQDNRLRTFIRWETRLMQECEFLNARLEFIEQCEKEYEQRKKTTESVWVEVSRPKRKKKVPQDLNLICRDCGRDFVFIVKHQISFSQKGWVNPKTCLTCVLNR